MKFTATLLYPAVVFGAAISTCPHAEIRSKNATCPYGAYQPETSTDIRGVCPMLNTLANHGYLPRNGRDIDEDMTVKALNDALNMVPSFGRFLFTAGRVSNPAPNATTFDLNHLDRHNLFEHDGSLSRQDAHFGQWSRFNQTVWDWTMQYWTSDILTLQDVANARAARAMRSNLTNPEYALSQLGYAFSTGENAAIVSILGDVQTRTCPKKFADYLFVNERLPHEVGWKKSGIPITLDDLADTLHDIQEATSYPPPPPPDNSFDVLNPMRKRWTHAGWM